VERERERERELRREQEQETKTMQSRQIVGEKKEDNDDQRVQLDSGSALQQCLDHIPITSISGINNSCGTY
jgi:hypothetical protein